MCIILSGCLTQKNHSTDLVTPQTTETIPQTIPPDTITSPTPTTEIPYTKNSGINCPKGQKPCGSACFDPSQSSCCKGVVIPALYMEDCGDWCYNKYTQSCCQGQVYQGTGDQWQICNASCYSSSEKTCINEILYNEPYLKFCGDSLYRSDRQSCISGNMIINGTNPIACGNTYCTSGEKCCRNTINGSVCYNPRFYECVPIK